MNPAILLRLLIAAGKVTPEIRDALSRKGPGGRKITRAEGRAILAALGEAVEEMVAP